MKRTLQTFQAFLLMLVFALVFSGCYKKDLEEFKNIKEISYQPEVALPFFYTTMTLEDTIPFLPAITMSDSATVELPNDEDSVTSLVEYVEFKCYLVNTFPFDGDVQIYFIDENDVKFDSLLSNTQRVIPQGNPKATKNFSVMVTAERYKDITNRAKNMNVYYTIQTSASTGLSDKSLLVKIGAKTKLALNIK